MRRAVRPPHAFTMSLPAAEQLAIRIDAARSVTALLQSPARARACFVLAHGAGAGMEHPFMTRVAVQLAARGIATLRYQFPYMERRSKRPDPPALCHATVRAAVAEAGRRTPELPLYAGGKSFGGRMTSQAQAGVPLEGVRGLAFLGFPLHPPGKASDERGAHLADVHIPMLFLQGSRDELARLELLEPLVARLGARATLRVFEDADHSFKRPARSARRAEDLLAELAEELASWMDTTRAADG